MTMTDSNFSDLTDSLLAQLNFDRQPNKDQFNSYLRAFRENAEKVKEGHAGFGGGSGEYDYTDFKHRGLIWRFHFCNDGSRYVDVHRA